MNPPLPPTALPSVQAGLPVLRRTSRSVEEELFDRPSKFEFFQAVRLLEMLSGTSVGGSSRPELEPAQFRGSVSLAFPPTDVVDLDRAEGRQAGHRMTVAFLGLLGGQGHLPLNYFERLVRRDRGGPSSEALAVYEWLGIFEHRLASLLFRAWKKYRLAANYSSREDSELDSFTFALASLIGLGTPSTRRRIQIAAPRRGVVSGALARLDDRGLIRYAGLLLARPRSAAGLESIVSDCFGVCVGVEQFRGQWLRLEPEQQSKLGEQGHNTQLGVSCVVGERVWSVESRFRLRIGPLSRRRFDEFLPDPICTSERKAIFLLNRLVRLYVGIEFDYEIQLVLQQAEVPECQLRDDHRGPRLGWDSWLLCRSIERDGDDATFDSSYLDAMEPGAS